VPPAAAAKTTQADDDVQWLMIGRPVTALKAWLKRKSKLDQSFDASINGAVSIGGH